MHYVTNDSYRSENGSYYESLLSSIDPTLQVITGEKDESSLTQIKFDEANYELGRLWIPYSIIAAFNLTVAVSFFWLFARGSRRIAIPKRRPYPTALNQTETVKNNRLFRIVILVLMFFFYFAYIGNEIVYSGFIYTFAIRSDLGFTTKSASYLNSAFWGGFAVVCALGIPSSIFLSAKTMLIIDLSGICISSILLAAFGDKNKAGLWGATILLGASMATLFPTGITWSERYIKLNGKAMGVLVMAAAAAEMILPWVVGLLFSIYGIMMLMYETFILSVCTIIVYIVMQTIASRHGERRNSLENRDSGAKT
ncbi:sodium-dependent glucose transporter 1-like [Ptychodera flava]|uniref:sodium-dependent glucose transporter 1-like n=1 Tax=Ptychodera flava TaxID=63121 RepID=UPI003969C1B0